MSFYRNHYINFVHYRNWGKMVEDSALCMGKICSDWNTSVPVRWCKTGRQQHDSCLQCRINSTQRSLRLQSCTVSIQASSNKIDVFFFFYTFLLILVLLTKQQKVESFSFFIIGKGPGWKQTTLSSSVIPLILHWPYETMCVRDLIPPLPPPLRKCRGDTLNSVGQRLQHFYDNVMHLIPHTFLQG